jgi:hypothetical protein
MKRTQAVLLAALTFTCQAVLLVEIFIQLCMRPDSRNAFKTMINAGSVIFARFFCALILHLTMMDEVVGSLEKMKYSVNHSY